MVERGKDARVLQWHPAFYAGMQIEFAHVKKQLYLENEHQLGTKPKEIDVLIIKKDSEEALDSNIGKIFRKHNLIEYKSPGDYFSIDDFYKVYGYACFYKSDTVHVDEIRAEEITITFVCSRFPKKLIKYLRRNRGFEVIQQEEGIYYIEGDVFPMQIVLLPKLSAEKNFWLRHLTNDIRDVRTAEKLLNEYEKCKGNKLYESLMDVIVRANWKVFNEVKGMCKALEELMKDELDERERIGVAQGMERGLERGLERGIKSLVEVCKTLGASWETALNMLRDKFQLTGAEAEKYMKMYW